MSELKPYAGIQPYCFISYAHKDHDMIWPILEEMQDHQRYRFWFDTGIHTGELWNEIIAEHIAGSEAAVIFMSPDYVRSENCMCELHYALNTLHKPFIVIFLLETRLSPGLEMSLSIRQHLYLYNMDRATVLYMLSRAEVLSRCKYTREEIELPQNSSYYIDAPIADTARDYFQGHHDQLGNFFLDSITGGTDCLPQLCYEKAYCLEKGLFCLKDEEKALEYYRIAAEAGSSKACCRLGVYYADSSKPGGLELSEHYLQAAADRGDIAGTYLLGVCLVEKRGMTHQGIALISEAAAEGFLPALNYMGILYNYGCLPDIPQDYEKMLTCYRQAAEELSPAQFNYASCCFWGEGLPEPDYEEAAVYFQKAAVSGDPDAVYRLGICYLAGLGVKRDPQYAGNLFLASAVTGQTEAAFSFGRLAFAERDYTTAVYWFRQGKEKEAAPCLWGLGLCALNGFGLEKNPEEAKELLTQSAAQHFPPAEKSLAKIQAPSAGDSTGPGVLCDPDGICELSDGPNLFILLKDLYRAAIGGDAGSQLQLGDAHQYGWGLAFTDYSGAAYWYQRALNAGLAAAADRLGELGATAKKKPAGLTS